jgi:hypothetical protein
MDIPLYDDNRFAPRPKEEVRIEQIDLVPYTDRFRVWVHIRVTPFLERPNLLLVLHDDDDRIVSELNIIETMHNDMEFTMHIRGKDEPAGVYSLSADLFYETRNPPQHRQVEGFIVPTAEEMARRIAEDQSGQ